ncbi:ABC transporter permease [Priestia megaterium]|uniref:ABC transporter permease n=1 Tax=Priestia megaterium TaxID=1404 RepID=UPI002EA5ED85|nr:ABC transporter permease [Priestia megaterium]
MIGRLLLSNNIKMKRSWSWLIVVFFALLPLLLIILYGLFNGGRSVEPQDIEPNEMWRHFVFSIHWILIFSLPLGITIQASIIANIEHQGNSWKQLLTLPLNKSQVYISKFLTLFIFNIISAFLLACGILLTGISLGIGKNIEWYTVLGGSFYPYLASLPIMAIQIWLSISIKNQAFSILFGVVFGMAGLFFNMNELTKWLPWSYPVEATPIKLVGDTKEMVLNSGVDYVVITAIVIGLVFLFIGLLDFTKREVGQ